MVKKKVFVANYVSCGVCDNGDFSHKKKAFWGLKGAKECLASMFEKAEGEKFDDVLANPTDYSHGDEDNAGVVIDKVSFWSLPYDAYGLRVLHEDGYSPSIIEFFYVEELEIE